MPGWGPYPPGVAPGALGGLAGGSEGEGRGGGGNIRVVEVWGAGARGDEGMGN